MLYTRRSAPAIWWSAAVCATGPLLAAAASVSGSRPQGPATVRPRARAAAPVRFQYRVVDLGSLGGGHTRPFALNNRGQVVGDSRTKDGKTHAFLWTAGHMRDLGTLGGALSSALATSNSGVIAGRSEDSARYMFPVAWINGRIRKLTAGAAYGNASAVNSGGDVVGLALNPEKRFHAFLWSKGKLRDLGTLGGPMSRATSINDPGEVAGNVYDSHGRPHAFVWRQGRMFALQNPLASHRPTDSSGAAAINASGDVAGDCWKGRFQRACVWIGGVAHDIGTLGGSQSTAESVNAHGEVCGSSFVPGGAIHAFLWLHGRLRDLGTVSGYPDSLAKAVNAQGVIVGDIGRHDPSRYPWLVEGQAFVWKNGRMTDLRDVAPLPGVTLAYAQAINDHGEIILSATSAGEQTGFLLIPVKKGRG